MTARLSSSAQCRSSSRTSSRGLAVELGERVGEVLHQQSAAPAGVDVVGEGVSEAGGDRLADLLAGGVAGAAQVAGQVEQQTAGGLGVAGEGGGAYDRELLLLGPAADRGEEARLADASLAGDQQQPAVAVGGSVDVAMGARERLVASDQDGRGDDVTYRHDGTSRGKP